MIPAFFGGIGRTRLALYVDSSIAVSLVVLAPVLGIWLHLGVDGTIYALFLGNAAGVALGAQLASRLIGARIDVRAILGTVLASACSSVVIVLIGDFGAGVPIVLGADLLIFAAVYLTLAPLLRVMNWKDLGTLQDAAKALGPLRRIVELALGYERLLLSLFASRGQ